LPVGIRNRRGFSRSVVLALVSGIIAITALFGGGSVAGAAQGRWVPGTYTVYLTFGYQTPYSVFGSMTLTAGNGGACPDDATGQWSVKGPSVTVTCTDTSEPQILVLKGHRTVEGIGSIKRPGSAVYTVDGMFAGSGTFYAVRQS
jgi:hypothetical protein